MVLMCIESCSLPCQPHIKNEEDHTLMHNKANQILARNRHYKVLKFSIVKNMVVIVLYGIDTRYVGKVLAHVTRRGREKVWSMKKCSIFD